MKKKKKTYKHPKVRKAFIIVGIVLASIAGLFLTLWGGINTFKFVAYKEFYSMTTKMQKIPDLYSGAVPQGITCYNEGYIMSMYMKDNKSPSRIYLMDKDESFRYVELYEDDQFQTPCTRHCGGVQYVDSIEKLYVADAKQYVFELDMTTLLNPETKKMKIQNVINVDNEASSIFSDQDYVYVSEFNKPGTEWVTKEEHKRTYGNEEHSAFVSVFPIDKVNNTVHFDQDPVMIYSTPNLIQGVAVRDNILYATTSWGLSSSHLYFYDMTKFKDLDATTKFVTSDSLIRDVKCPPMLEDLDFNFEGKLITYNESASSKYIFGRLFFADRIYGIKVK